MGKIVNCIEARFKSVLWIWHKRDERENLGGN